MANIVTSIICSDVARLALALLLVGGSIVLLGLGRDVPSVLWALDGAAVGFYFGGASVNAANRGS